MKKNNKNIIVVLMVCFIITLYGVIVISGNLPKFIKDRTAFKINYSLKPFDFRFDMGEYSLYINSKVITNIKNSSNKVVKNVEKNICNDTSSIINKTSNTFKYFGDKINNSIQHKVR
jgi:predicted PurR-regulated permease PerM